MVRSKNKYTPNDSIAENRRERRLVGGRTKVYADVLACIRVADLAKPREHTKHIEGKKLRGITVELETTDKLKERQVIAKAERQRHRGVRLTKGNSAHAVVGKRARA